MDSTPKMPAIKIETEKMNGWTNADIMEENCCSKPLTSTPVAKNCRATASSKQEHVNWPSDLSDNLNQCQSLLIAEHKPSGLESCLETTHFSVQNAGAPVAEGHPDKLQLPAEPCRDFPSAAGRAEPSALNVAEDEDESIYFTPELYDDAEPEEQRTEPPLPACCAVGNWVEYGNSTVPADLFAISTSETLNVAEKAEAGRSRSPHGIVENERSRGSAVDAVEVAGAAGAEQGGSQEMDTPKRKISLSRSRNKGVSSFLLGSSGTR